MRAYLLRLTLTATMMLATACGSLGRAASAGPTPAPADRVKAYVAAMNRGDVEASLAFFTDDVEYSLVYYIQRREGLQATSGTSYQTKVEARGIEELRVAFEWLAGLATSLQISDCQPRADGATCTLPIYDACITAAGADDGVVTRQRFVFGRDGKIKSVAGKGEGPCDLYLGMIITDAYGWMEAGGTLEPGEANKPGTVPQAGTSADRRAAGALQARLCRDYAMSIAPARREEAQP